MNKRDKILNKYWEAVSDVLYWFVEKYFVEEDYIPQEDVDYFIIPSWAYTGTLHIADYYISWEVIEYCIKKDVQKETFFAWMDYVEEYEYSPPINHYTFFTSYPHLPCTKAKTTTKKKSTSTTKLSTGNRKPSGVKR